VGPRSHGVGDRDRYERGEPDESEAIARRGQDHRRGRGRGRVPSGGERRAVRRGPWRAKWHRRARLRGDRRRGTRGRGRHARPEAVALAQDPTTPRSKRVTAGAAERASKPLRGEVLQVVETFLLVGELRIALPAAVLALVARRGVNELRGWARRVECAGSGAERLRRRVEPPIQDGAED